MAISPKYAGLELVVGDSPAAHLHTVELFLDYVCPFSAKMYKTLYTAVLEGPAGRSAGYANKVRFVFRPQIQPWHPSSTLVHEAALAVLQLAPAQFWRFSAALFEHQKDYFDVSLVHEPRNDTYRRLARLGAASAGVDAAALYDLLRVPDKPAADGSLNVGNKVTTDLKYVVKTARLLGVHVSPTVLFNGVVESAISSSFSADQWSDWLHKNAV